MRAHSLVSTLLRLAMAAGVVFAALGLAPGLGAEQALASGIMPVSTMANPGNAGATDTCLPSPEGDLGPCASSSLHQVEPARDTATLSSPPGDAICNSPGCLRLTCPLSLSCPNGVAYRPR